MTESTTPPATHKPTGNPLLPPREQEYDYHWGRIFLVILVVLVLGGITAYGYHVWFSSPPEEALEMAEVLPESELAVDDQHQVEQLNDEIPEPFSREEAETLPTLIADATDATNDSQELKPLLEEAVIEAENLSQINATAELMETHPSSSESAPDSASELTDPEPLEGEVSDKPVYFVDSEIAPDTQATEISPEAPLPDEIAKAEVESSAGVSPDEMAERAEPIAATTNGSFQLQDAKTHAPRVKRFLLTRAISNKEPLGELSDIEFKADGSAVVWAYSEVVEMSGERLNYVWLHDGNQVARVSVSIRGNRWRSYSSKNINQGMSGAWRVELQDDEGRLLASVDFSL